MTIKVLAALVPLLLSAGPAPSKDATQDPLKPIAPLLGRWAAEPDLKMPGVTGWTTFSKELQERVVVRKNHAEYPAQKDRPASIHDDLMVVFAENGRLRADYFDNEGHVIRYEVQTPKPSTLVFLSDAQPGVPRFRLTYAWSTPEKLDLTFEMAPPGKPDEFRPYIAARLRKE